MILQFFLLISAKYLKPILYYTLLYTIQYTNINIILLYRIDTYTNTPQNDDEELSNKFISLINSPRRKQTTVGT